MDQKGRRNEEDKGRIKYVGMKNVKEENDVGMKELKEIMIPL